MKNKKVLIVFCTIIYNDNNYWVELYSTYLIVCFHWKGFPTW